MACDVTYLETWNGCIDYQKSDMSGKVYIFHNAYHHKGMVGMKFESNTGATFGNTVCFDKSLWHFRIVRKQLSTGDDSFFERACPNMLPWSRLEIEDDEDDFDLASLGSDELDAIFLERVRQIEEDEDSRIETYQDIALEWVSYNMESAWLIVWLPSSPFSDDYAVSMTYPTGCNIGGQVILMACGNEELSSSFPSLGGKLFLTKAPEFQDTVIFYF